MIENIEEKKQENQVDNPQEPDIVVDKPKIQLIEVEQANWEIFVPVKNQNQSIIGFRQI